ncbi:MAG TPA: ATP-dependent DNA ligase [Actinomycetota bacterium]|nr:ATP-dependent DNA ligase [Actinomycetota bacterium]
MSVPFESLPQPMLARLASELPRGAGWVYEPKYDGFRALVAHDDGVRVVSRDGRDLERYFPELPPVLAGALPRGCVVDGEVLVPTPRGVDFDALLQRIHPAASRVALLARDTPATFVAFDVLAAGGEDLCARPLSERLARLESLLGASSSDGDDAIRDALTGAARRVVVTPRTDDHERGRGWMSRFEGLGLDGVVAKRLDAPYRPGKRDMVKVKLQRTADCVVGGYRLSKTGDGVGSLLLGLYDDAGVLHYVGHTSGFRAAERRALLGELRALEGDGGFGGGRAPGGPSRWTGGRDTSWVSLRPELVCEVSFDRVIGERFRHAVGFVRWRRDKAPSECRFDQLRAPSA